MTNAVPQHAHPGAIARGWRAVRRWRRARPFWGGLFLLLASLEIFQSTQASVGGLTFQTGPTGYLSWLIPTVLAACGLLMWFTPQQRMFYAIVGTVTALFSLIAVNLGGFFIGLLLGMVGGALGFAWAPSAPAPAADEDAEPGEADSDEARVRDSTVDELVAGPLTDTLPQPRNPLREPVESALPGDGPTGHGEPRFGRDLPGPPPDDSGGGRRRPPRHSPPALAITLVMLGVAVIAALSPGSAAYAASCPPAAASAAPSRSAAPAGAATTPSSAIQPPSLAAPLDLTGGADAVPLASYLPTPALTTGAEASTPTVPPIPVPTSCPTRQPTAAPTRGQPTGPAKPADHGQPTVAERPARLTGSKLTMTGSKLDGVVDLPTASGNLRALKFSMQKAVTRDFRLEISGGHAASMLVRSRSLTVDGHVAFYTTRFAGRILGVEVVLTPESPMPPDGVDLTVPVLVFDDPDVQLAFVDCDGLTAPGFAESFA